MIGIPATKQRHDCNGGRTMTDSSLLLGHEPVAAFRVGAILATQAIAVYVDPDPTGGPYDPSPAFAHLPTLLKIRVLEACEEAFRQQREALVREDQAKHS
jgi:hypothetical protein